MAKNIKAKFRCSSVEKVDAGTEVLEKVKLQPVYAETGINKQWSQHTPSGELTMQISNREAQGFIEPGKEYILDIRLAEEGE